MAMAKLKRLLACIRMVYGITSVSVDLDCKSASKWKAIDALFAKICLPQKMTFSLIFRGLGKVINIDDGEKAAMAD